MQPAAALSARTPFDQAQFGIKITKGVAEIEQGLVDGPAGHLLVSGSATLPTRKLDLRAVVLPLVPDEPLSNAAQNHNISVRGPWDHPLVAPAAP
jgi:AsmA protein